MKSRVVFMGTPEFSSYILEQIVSMDVNVVGVVTIPDKPAGRGQVMSESEVKKTALRLNLKVLQPEKLKNEQFITELKALAPDFIVVIAFRMLPKEVWQIPKLGTFNLHASLLPQYRGAAPINWAIINGETQTGLTTFLIDEQIDTGKILLRQEVAIEPGETAGTLHDKLMKMGPKLVKDTIEGLKSGEILPVKQDDNHTILKSAPKLFKEDGRITGLKTAKETHQQILGMIPYPGTFIVLRDSGSNSLYFKIQQAELTHQTSNHEKGIVKFLNKKEIYLYCSDYQLKLLKIQPSGKKSMLAEEFLRGFKLKSVDWQVVTLN